MSHKRKVLQGSASNMVRVVLSMLVSLVLPPFLVHHMPTVEYSAWVLILQLSAYVALLDFGLQTAIGKFVAEYDANDDRESSRRLVSTSFTILAAASAIACLAVCAMAYSVPHLFHQMPPALVPEVRIALLAIGLSTSVGLPFSSFQSIFFGLQQYVFPTVLMIFTRVGSAASLIVLLMIHGSLVQLALVMAGFNLVTAVIQFLGWRRLVKPRVDFSFLLFDRPSAVRLAKYGSVLSVWTLAMFFVSGLDVVIVGHYRYKDTGYYAIASSVANFMLVVISSVFGPLIPAVSSMQAGMTPSRLGALCVRITRYCALLLCMMGLPLILGAYPLLSLWVGKGYAAQSALYLEVLIAGYVVRQLALPYILMVMATGKQHLATIAAICEASVNIVLSVYLVQRIGAVGVAIGTLVGAFVSVGVHFAVSIPLTQEAIFIRRPRFLAQGVLRSLLIVSPTLCLYPFWRRSTMLPAPMAVMGLWLLLSAGLAWWVVLTADDRREAGGFVHRLLNWGAASS